MSEATSKEEEAIGCVLLLIAPPAVTLFEGWALSVLWSQNAVPLGAQAIGGWPMVGLVCLLTGIRIVLMPARYQKESPGTYDALGRVVGEVVVLLALVGISTVAS